MIRRRRGSGSQGAIAAISPGSAHKWGIRPSPLPPSARRVYPPAALPGTEGGAGTDVEAAAGEGLDDRVAAVERVVTRAAGSGEGEVEGRRGRRGGRRGRSRPAGMPAMGRNDAETSEAPGSRRTRGLLLSAPESGSARLVVGQEGAWQCYGARAGQVGRCIDEPVARGRDAEHRGE